MSHNLHFICLISKSTHLLKLKTPFDPVIPLLAVYPIGIAVLFIIAKLWKEPKCPSEDEWIKKKKKRYIYTMEYYIAV